MQETAILHLSHDNFHLSREFPPGQNPRRRRSSPASVLIQIFPFLAPSMSSSDSSPLGLSQWLVDDSDDEDAGDALQSNFQFDSPGSAAAAEASESSEDPEVRPLAFASELTPPLQILQRQQQGIGFHLWPAAVFLCRCLEQAAGAAAAEDEQWGQLLPSPIEEASVLELGAGVGLVGLFCAALGAPRVVLSDLPEVLPALEENIALNADALGVQADRGEGGSRVQAMPLAWGTADVEHYIDSRGTDDRLHLLGASARSAGAYSAPSLLRGRDGAARSNPALQEGSLTGATLAEAVGGLSCEGGGSPRPGRPPRRRGLVAWRSRPYRQHERRTDYLEALPHLGKSISLSNVAWGASETASRPTTLV
eukprot:scaffold1467_cov264-Pinguiococcus_pyrenoidosus.AAC.26